MKKQITTEELQNLKQLQNDYGKLVNDLGSIELQIIDFENGMETLNSQKKEIKEEIKKIRRKETDMAKMLNEKYGKGIIDIETGEISDN